MIYDESEVYTYDRAVQFCLKHGLQLCSRDQYCEGGKGGALLPGAGEMAYLDKWAPVSDDHNSWVQTGDGGEWGHRRCWTHAEHELDKPWWGVTGWADDEEDVGKGLCCVIAPGLLCMICVLICVCVRVRVYVYVCVYACVCNTYVYICVYVCTTITLRSCKRILLVDNSMHS